MENSGYSMALGEKSKMSEKSAHPVVVYAYMCGDLLHYGHILHLKNAKALGDILIVGVLTDEAITERKSPPTMSFDERVRAIEAIKYVDIVVCQSTYSPVQNILDIKPDIVAESSSHDEELVASVQNSVPTGAEVIILPYYRGISSGDIKKRIKNANHVVNMLNPWYHPLEICGETVIPGIGSGRSSQELIDRNKFREKLLVDQVIKHYDFKGKSILDVGSNVSYWCSKYVKYGAISVTALEGRNKYILQGLLYWSSNQFLPESNYEFINCDILDPSFWNNNMSGKLFDFVFCGGIFHHIKDHDFLLKKLIESSVEAVLIDTKIGDNTFKSKTDYFFGNIESYDELKLPDVNHIIDIFTENGFKTNILPSPSSYPVAMREEDDYCNGKRIAVLFTRIKK
jgi:cytidyltransferase-like protein